MFQDDSIQTTVKTQAEFYESNCNTKIEVLRDKAKHDLVGG